MSATPNIDARRVISAAPISELATLGSSGVLMKPEQASASLDQNCYVSIAAESPSFGTVFQGTQSTARIKIQKGRLFWLQRALLHFNVAVTGASVVLNPTPFWIQYIEVRCNNGSGPVVQRITSDELYLQLALMTDEQIKCIGRSMGVDAANYSIGPDNAMAANTSRDFYLPLNTLLTNYLKVNMNTLQEDLTLDLYFMPSCVSSGSGVVSLTTLDLIFESDIPYLRTAKDQEVYNRVGTSVQAANILDVVDISFGAQYVFSPSSKQRIRLDQLNGKKLAALFFTLRPSGTQQTAAAATNQVFLGIDSQFDMTKGTASLIGQGTPVRYGMMMKTLCDNFSSGFFAGSDATARRTYHMLTFSDDPAAVLSQALVKNLLTVDNTDYWLEITPGSATGANAVQTCTLASAATGGSYCFVYNGEMSAPLAYNATVAQMKAAFEALPAANRESLNVAFSATAAAGTSFTATFSPMRPVNTISVVPLGLNASGTALYPTVASTTTGVFGIAANTTLDLHVLGICYNEAIIRNGQITTRTL